MELKPPSKKNNTIKARRSLITGITLGIITISSLVFLGMKIEQSRYEKPLPANEACLQAVEGASKLLAGEQVDVHALVAKCRENVSKYEVVVAK